MHKIQTLNNIAKEGLDRFSIENYSLANKIDNPTAIVLRSYDLHEFEISNSVKAIARAGAGVNNIPVDLMSNRGMPVFNTRSHRLRCHRRACC